MKKRVLAIVLTVLLCLSLLPVGALAYGETSKKGVFNTICVSDYHSAAITEDGSLYTWGSNEWGQLGFGYTSEWGTFVATPTKVPSLSNVVSVSLGYSYSAAITSDGSLYTWGSGYAGQLGHGDTVDRPSPTKVEALKNVVAVNLGENASAAITEDGSLYTWGVNQHGQLGLGFVSDYYYSGDDIAFYSPVSTPTKVTALANVVAVSMSYSSGSAITADGSLYTWGLNVYGQLGLGYVSEWESPVLTPTKVPTLSNVVAVSKSSMHTAAITADGSLYTWGQNSFGQLGLGYVSEWESPVLVPSKVPSLSNIVSVSLGQTTTMALTSDGILYKATWTDELIGSFERVNEISDVAAISTIQNNIGILGGGL